jgi:hypothetical protein
MIRLIMVGAEEGKYDDVGADDENVDDWCALACQKHGLSVENAAVVVNSPWRL